MNPTIIIIINTEMYSSHDFGNVSTIKAIKSPSDGDGMTVILKNTVNLPVHRS